MARKRERRRSRVPGLTDSMKDHLLNGRVMLTIPLRELFPNVPHDYPFMSEGHRHKMWIEYKADLLALCKLPYKDRREAGWHWYSGEYRPHAFWDYEQRKPRSESEEAALKRLGFWTTADDEVKAGIQAEREERAASLRGLIHGQRSN